MLWFPIETITNVILLLSSKNPYHMLFFNIYFILYRFKKMVQIEVTLSLLCYWKNRQKTEIFINENHYYY